MGFGEMMVSWNQMHRVLLVVLVLHLQIQESWSINDEGLALLEFRARVETDPYGALSNWNPDDTDPCMWSGVNCVDGEVEMLDLKELSLEGTLGCELGKLRNLRAIILYKNRFFGIIPKEIAGLTMLEVLDLRGNRLSGKIPVEIGDMQSLKHVLLCDNNFHGMLPEFRKLNMITKLQYDQKLTSSISRKLGNWFKFGKGSSHDHKEKCYDNLSRLTESYIAHNVHLLQTAGRRRLLEESHNLAATPVSGAIPDEITTIPSLGTGSFPAIPNSPNKNGKEKQLPAPTLLSSANPTSILKPHANTSPTNNENNVSKGSERWKYVFVLPAGAFLLTVAAAMIFMCRSRGVATIGPWKTGLSGQLQKAFVTGVPKLNRGELETACEDFSNIIGTYPHFTLFKGTLSSGVEIAVASTSVPSAKDWSRRSEVHFRKKIDTLSRVNHKNFVNLLGYCEEDEPFLRMMVFEYAPSGLLSEHLHVKEVEHLDWAARMRIVMGVAYCLQYMHHELNPPAVHSNLQSRSICLTDDFAAKILEYSFWKDFVAKGKISRDEDADPSELPSTDTESNVYSFGMLLLEIISGKLPYSEEQGSLANWAAEYLNDKRSISYLIDPTLKSFKNNELDVICEVIQECIDPESRQRPTMKEITAKLRQVLGISPDAATPRLSPLWWAELEILSVEAS
ncbi:leucine-rich repeat protein kinase family protein isoform X2 [Tasmannia lanceolata]|uniref:leucine-rich repeat protein kinase family protein isoform X2 n=1 Tax=Tasmannia lanceolata TaxID=3420 RepID=UPI004063A56B